MDLPVLAWRNQGLREREEAQGGGGRLDLCEGSHGMDDRCRIWNGSPPRVETSITESNPRHPGHATTHQLGGAGALGGKDPLHAPRGARAGSTPLPHPAQLGTRRGRQGLDLIGISSRNQRLEDTSHTDGGSAHSPGKYCLSRAHPLGFLQCPRNWYRVCVSGPIQIRIKSRVASPLSA